VRNETLSVTRNAHLQSRPFTGWNLQMRKQYWRANGQSVHSMAAGKKAFTYGFFRDVDAQGTPNWDCLSKSRYVSFHYFGRGF